MQPADLPGGVVRCGLSGDMASFLAKEKGADATTYATVKSDWDAARQNGATAAYAALYTDSAAHCAKFGVGESNPGAATYQLVINFVLQFKDEASAAGAYADGSFFHFSVADLKSGGAAVVEGIATGLTEHAIERSAVLANQTVFVALWQKKQIVVVLAILNLAPAASQKAAVAENTRIK